ncbi:MAG: hypothetical protein HRT88_20295 [Lentisphaeraceae bacterium]|nr:hypothetical protein [Lentisphaeraceae bacterium]
MAILPGRKNADSMRETLDSLNNQRQTLFFQAMGQELLERVQHNVATALEGKKSKEADKIKAQIAALEAKLKDIS